ncbi:MAG: M24 family metallopeptidase, partial [Anaerolineaceae bacterium]|nr:M24 family metallopeptidase [Anaerolineaceae bacterium]
ANLTHADLIKRRGEPPVLFHHTMEREEAARSELRTITYDRYPLEAWVREAGGNRSAALARRYRQMFTDLDIHEGRIALYGRDELGPTWATLSSLQRIAPQLEFAGDLDDSLLLQARATKDSAEVERIRKVGRATAAVVDQVAQSLRRAPVREGCLLNEQSQPLTIGQVKRQIEVWLVEGGLENPEGGIFSIGRGAGVPHTTGNNEDVIRQGETIVFDIFPCESGGGYFYDFTRTWCVGFAPPAAQALYDAVRAVLEQLRRALQPGMLAASLQALACDLFEAQGYATLRSQPGTTDGFVHGLGHGVGLFIHERPNFGYTATSQDVLAPGAVFTLEPGLYYPERGLGVRLEDTYFVEPDGRIEPLVEYPLDLVL